MGVEEWCQTEGLPQQISLKKKEMEQMYMERLKESQEEHEYEGEEDDYSYDEQLSAMLWKEVEDGYQYSISVLEALRSTPLTDPDLNLTSWKLRYFFVVARRFVGDC